MRTNGTTTSGLHNRSYILRIARNQRQQQMLQLRRLFHKRKTSLVTILGSTAIAVMIVNIYSYAMMTAGQPSFLTHIILLNLPYLDMSLHMVVYGLYFRKIRQPLCRRLKGMMRSCTSNKKMNSVSPYQALYGRSIQTAWE